VRLCFDRLDLSNDRSISPLRMHETGRRHARNAIRLYSVHARDGGAPALLCIFRGDSDANEVQGFGGRRRRSGGGHIERSDGEISVCAGLRYHNRVCQPVRSPGYSNPVSGAVSGEAAGAARGAASGGPVGAVVGGALGTASGTLTGTGNMLSGH
jgi:hypothetical protein